MAIFTIHIFLPCKEKMLVRKELRWFLADQNNLLIENSVIVQVGTLVLCWWFFKIAGQTNSFLTNLFLQLIMFCTPLKDGFMNPILSHR